MNSQFIPLIFLRDGFIFLSNTQSNSSGRPRGPVGSRMLDSTARLAQLDLNELLNKAFQVGADRDKIAEILTKTKADITKETLVERFQ